MDTQDIYLTCANISIPSSLSWKSVSVAKRPVPDNVKFESCTTVEYPLPALFTRLERQSEKRILASGSINRGTPGNSPVNSICELQYSSSGSFTTSDTFVVHLKDCDLAFDLRMVCLELGQDEQRTRCRSRSCEYIGATKC